MSGVVVKAGPKAPFSPGQHVFGRQTLERIREVNGTYAEFCVADGKELCLKPEEVSFENAAAVPWAGLTALGAIEHVGGIGYKNSTGGRRAVLVIGGSGGVGNFAVQIAKHYMRCYVAATASSVNQRFLKQLGADEVINYTDPDFWAGVTKPQLGQGKTGFNLVLDCVGGDDYWEKAQDLLVEDGHYVTLVGPQRYGSEAMTVGSAINTQVTSGIRKGLGLLGASKKYTVFTPSMTKSEDLEVLAKLLKENTISSKITKVEIPHSLGDFPEGRGSESFGDKFFLRTPEHLCSAYATSCCHSIRCHIPCSSEPLPVHQANKCFERVQWWQVYSMYDIMDAHEHLDGHHAVGKCILQVRKGLPEEDKDEGSQPDEDEDEVDLRDMVLDKETMRLVPRSKANQSGMGDDLKKQQMEVAARIKAATQQNGAPNFSDKDNDWSKKSKAAAALAEMNADLYDGGKKNARNRPMDMDDDDLGDNQRKTVSFAAKDEVEELDDDQSQMGGGQKLSRKEQYRLAVMQAKEEIEAQQTGGAPGGGAGIKPSIQHNYDTNDAAEAVKGAVTHAGVLKKKKKDHGRFEDPYKTTCVATLERGVLTLKITHNGELSGVEETYDLSQGWKLVAREDKKDRFTLVRSGPASNPSDDEVTLKADSKAEGENWIEKLRETAAWFADRRNASLATRGAGGGGANTAQSYLQNLTGVPLGDVPKGSSKPQPKPQPTENSAPKEKAGVGMILKQHSGTLIVKKMADGAPADASGQIEVGDILLKVDGQAVNTAEQSAQYILGDVGSTVSMVFEREQENGKKKKFTVKLKRGKAPQ